eukprot:GILJ01021579.1.p1 GENE.GILJ01021579.1~~GILJ01021579.1.p1  ORF type:complete len:127 (-),score=9.38 GILJ01021579.1:709-1035(-)
MVALMVALMVSTALLAKLARSVDESASEGTPVVHVKVKLNIGGTLFETTKETLLRRGANFFSDLDTRTLREQGGYFIDRDGHYFVPLLELLRTGDFRPPATLYYQALL